MLTPTTTAGTCLAPPARTLNLALAATAFPLFAFALYLLLRRSMELAGIDPGLGASLVIAACLALALCVRCFGRRHAPALVAIAAGMAILAAAAAIGFHALPDNGFDPQSYHLPSVLRLLHGWKPIREATDLTLSNDYPNGVWLIQAGFDAIFSFESGRAFGLLIGTAALAFTAFVLSSAGYRPLTCGLLAIFLAGNTVTISQFFTGFIDGPLYELALILICALVQLFYSRELAIPLIGASALILLINSKSAAVFFAPLAIAAWLLVLMFRDGPAGALAWLQERRRDVFILAAAALIAVLFVGWRPYMTNLIEHHSIIYPPPEELGYRPHEPGQVPANLDGTGRISKLEALFFAKTNMDGGPVEYKLPGTWTPHELRMASDTRNGGFGPFFGAEIIMAAAALALALWRRVAIRGHEFPWTVMLFALLATVLFPEPWWARFVPVAWALPLAGIMLAAAIRPGPIINIAAIFVFSLAAINMTIAGYWSVTDGLAAARDLRGKARAMASDAQPVYLSQGTLWNSTINGRHAAEEVWRERLRALGKTDVIFVPRSDCVAVQFLSVDVQHCRAPASPAGGVQ